jgi:pimeloyl-ACP methyl ester carboxylesterase
MKTHEFSLGRVALALVLLAALAGCVPPTQSQSATPEGVLSFDELLANLDALQGPETRSLTLPDRSVFMTSAGASVRTQDLSAYLNGVRNSFASYVSAQAGGKPYLVLPVKLSLPDSNSGLMWVPFTWGKHISVPIISYQHGTQVNRKCAPSRFNPNPLAVLSSPDQTGALQSYVECIVGALMATAGYIVVMPDYPGFGDSVVPHPYVHMSLGNSVRDSVRKAQALLAGGVVSPNGKVFLTGYSEGGYTTVAGARALQMAGSPPTAIVPCDGAYDLSGVMLNQILSDQQVKVPSYFLYAASGYQSVYGTSAIDYYALFTSAFADLLAVQKIFDGNHTNQQIGTLVPPTTIPSSMLNDGTATGLLSPGGLVHDLLKANDSYRGWVPTAPVVFIHCRTDDVVPYANAEVARAAVFGAASGVYGPAIALSLVPPIVEVPPVPLIEQVMGEVHIAAFPTAMLAAFTVIEMVNRGF